MIFEIQKFLYWQGNNSQNEFVHGYIYTQDISLAEKFLVKQNIRPEKFQSKWKISKATKLKIQTTITFYKQLSALLRAGITLTQAIATLTKTHENFFQKILLTVRMDIEVGNSFYVSLNKHPKQFDPFSCQLIHIAEQTGTLDNMLEHIAIYHEKRKIFADALKQALLYPIIILSSAIIVSIIMLAIVVPQFANIFADFNAPLPTMTLLVIYISNLIRNYYWLSLFPIILIYLSKKYILNKIISLPFLNNFLQISFNAKFAHALSLMINAGIPIASALSLIEKVNFNEKHKEALNSLQTKIAKGFAIYTSLAESNIFTPLMLQMVKVGEESGMLTTMLNNVANLHEAELQHTAKQLTQLLEPLIIIMLGVLIGGLVISMYLPIFKLGTVM